MFRWAAVQAAGRGEGRRGSWEVVHAGGRGTSSILFKYKPQSWGGCTEDIWDNRGSQSREYCWYQELQSLGPGQSHAFAH